MATISKSALAKFGALSESNRMNIILFLASCKDAPPAVSAIAEAANLPVVNASHHLGVLESAGLVVRDRDGRFTKTVLNPEVFNYSNKEDSCGYFAFDGYKIALPGLNSVNLKKASKPAKNGSPKKAAPKKEEAPVAADNDDDDDEE